MKLCLVRFLCTAARVSTVRFFKNRLTGKVLRYSKPHIICLNQISELDLSCYENYLPKTGFKMNMHSLVQPLVLSVGCKLWN